ncbi:hypothetical protein T07_6, partial [Trichinella nelsoni]
MKALAASQFLGTLESLRKMVFWELQVHLFIWWLEKEVILKSSCGEPFAQLH